MYFWADELIWQHATIISAHTSLRLTAYQPFKSEYSQLADGSGFEANQAKLFLWFRVFLIFAFCNSNVI